MRPKDNRRSLWVLALTSAVSFMVSLDSQVVATALPVIRLRLHASLAALEWTVNAYTLSFAVLLLTGAAAGERLGRRRMLAAGVGLFTAASAACALAPNAGGLIAARAVQGAGAALMLPLALALLSANFPPQRRAWALGIFSSVTGIAVLAGLFLATAGALGLVWALIRADSLSWASPETTATLAAGALLGTAFVVWELRTSNPMVPIRLFGQRSFAAGNAATFTVFAMLLALVFFMAQFLQDALGYDPLGTGLRLLPRWAMLTLIAPFGGALIGPAMGACAGLALLGAVAGLIIPAQRRPAPAAQAQPSPQPLEIRR